jgi:hypothetical protein
VSRYQAQPFASHYRGILKFYRVVRPYLASVAQSPNSWGADIVGEVQRDPTTAPAGVAPDYARLGKPVSQLEELAAGNLHREVCEGGDSGASQYRISPTRRR